MVTICKNILLFYLHININVVSLQANFEIV